MNNLDSLFSEIVSATEEDYLATIIHVEGSAYLREGAMMLFKKDGKTHGLLSIGCIEEDISARLKQLLIKGPEIIQFDMRSEDDLSWGAGSGCNGIIHVLIENCHIDLRTSFLTVQQSFNRGETTRLLKRLSLEQPGKEMLVLKKQKCVFSSWNGENANYVEKWSSTTDMRNGRFMNLENHESIYIQTFKAQSRLIIFGAGDDVIPLVEVVSQLDFLVIVVDWREQKCSSERFKKADVRLIAPIKEALEHLAINQEDFIIIMTHQFNKDQELIQYFMNVEVSYLGILGSKHRKNRLLGDKKINKTIHSPIGERIHAEGPYEIAISIAAQLIKFKHKPLTEQVALNE